jgi:hypothetical protein
MEDEVKAAVFGNVGTMIAFRVGATDAEIFEKEFAPYFIMDDIVNLSAYQIYLRLMIDGVGSKPFSAHTLDPIPKPHRSFAREVLVSSQKTYGRPVAEVELEVQEFYKQEEKTPKPTKQPLVQDTYIPPFEKKEKQLPIQPINHDGKPMSRSKDSIQLQTPRPERRSEDRRASDRSPRKEAPVFDNKPAMSLKEALQKAMEEKNTASTAQEPEPFDNIDHNVSPPKAASDKKPAKEVPEDLLRTILKD